jgi:hypothetical protein
MLKYIACCICLFLLFTSCEKQKISDGTEDLCRTWKVATYEVDGSNETDFFHATYLDYTISFYSDGNFTEQSIFVGVPVTITGTWLFQNHVKEIKLIDPTETRIYTIIDLSSLKLTVEDESTATDDVYYLEPN